MLAGKIIAFVPARDLHKAKPFYEGILGLTCLHADEFALTFDAEGVKLQVTQVDSFKPQSFTILGWEVDDICEAASHFEQKGVRLEHYGLKNQNERGIWTAPSGAMVVWFKDPDGNVLSLTQFPGWSATLAPCRPTASGNLPLAPKA